MKAKLSNKLTSRYLNVQVLLNGLNCVIGSYAAIFLKFKGFTNVEIGIILSTAAIISMIIQPLIASFADKTEKFTLRQISMFIVVLNVFFTFIILLGNGIKPLVFIFFIIITAIHGTLSPLVNSLAVEFINKGVFVNYGLARGTGSLAFAVTSIMVGLLIGKFNPNILIVIGLIFYSLEFICVYSFEIKPYHAQYLATPSREESDKRITRSSTSTLQFLGKYKKYTMFLIGIMLVYYSYLLINTYFINIFENVGGGSRELGIGLAIAATLELPIMASFTLLLRKFKISSMIKFAAFFYLVKTVVTLLATSVPMLYFSQTLQPLCFGIFTPASLYYANEVIPSKDSVKGQTMINVATFGLASVLASITGGFLQDTVGIFNMLLISAVVTGVGVLIVFWAVHDTKTT